MEAMAAVIAMDALQIEAPGVATHAVLLFDDRYAGDAFLA